jgi:hypothetical protein
VHPNNDRPSFSGFFIQSILKEIQPLSTRKVPYFANQHRLSLC